MNRIAVSVVVLLGLAGCGGSNSAPAPAAGGADVPPATSPPPATDPYEMDPAKHVIPNQPVAGRLGGKPFAPDRVELTGGTLSFTQGTEAAAREVELFFVENPAKLVVRPDGGAVVTVRVRTEDGKSATHAEKFALTL